MTCANCDNLVMFTDGGTAGRCAVYGITVCHESPATQCWWYPADSTGCETMTNDVTKYCDCCGEVLERKTYEIVDDKRRRRYVYESTRRFLERRFCGSDCALRYRWVAAVKLPISDDVKALLSELDTRIDGALRRMRGIGQAEREAA